MASTEKKQNSIGNIVVCQECVSSSEEPLSLHRKSITEADWIMIKAARLGHVQCLQGSLAAGAHVNRSDENGLTALMRACESGHVKCVEILLTFGSWINKKNKLGDSALIFAVDGSHYECADLLIKAGANRKKDNVNTDRALSIAAWRGSPDCVELLIKAGADVDRRNHHGTTALMFAAGRGYRKCADVLITAGADVNRRGYRNTTALICAANCGRIGCVDALIASGAEEADKSTALLYAANNTYYKCLDALIKAGADINGIDAYHITPLFYALGGIAPSVAMVECVRSLLLAGANVNVEKISGYNCQAEICRLQELNSNASSLQLVINLLLAAGEELVDVEYPDASAEEICLKDPCRRVIRKHLLNLNRNENLFVRVPRLEIPAVLKDYLLFYQTLLKLECDDTTDDNKGYNDDHGDDDDYPFFHSFEIMLSHNAWA